MWYSLIIKSISLFIEEWKIVFIDVRYRNKKIAMESGLWIKFNNSMSMKFLCKEIEIVFMDLWWNERYNDKKVFDNDE